MDPFRKKPKQWKLFFRRMLPYCILGFLFLACVAVIRDALRDAKANLSTCGDSASGEVVHRNTFQVTNADEYYYTLFQRLLKEGYISPASKALCIETTTGEDVNALKKIGVADVTGISELPYTKFVISGQGFNHPFNNNTFDFEFFGYSSRFKYWAVNPAHTASEIGRTLKDGGYLVAHMVFTDEYSFNSFVDLFTCCRLISSRPIAGFERSFPSVTEVILKKEAHRHLVGLRECKVPQYKRRLIDSLEPIVTFEQPYSWEGPWGNENSTIQYLSAMVDLSFKDRYIYIDVGANHYHTSISSFFEKEYPKQNKTFHIYAIEADKAFHEEYIGKEGITLVPYAAWVRNETLSLQIYKVTPNEGERFDEMGFIPEKQASTKEELATLGRVFTVEAFDFIEWLQRTVTKRDFVVMKMDVEGAEVHLLKRMIETGTMCLIDELFLECHYDRWLKCCSGPKSNKYQFKFEQCLNTFRKLRNDGCIVHQWW